MKGNTQQILIAICLCFLLMITVIIISTSVSCELILDEEHDNVTSKWLKNSNKISLNSQFVTQSELERNNRNYRYKRNVQLLNDSLIPVFHNSQQIIISPIPPSQSSPVIILSDTDFSTQGWPGNGTSINPYRIENQVITHNGSMGHCIDIRNTRVHFLIQNCMLQNAYYAAINLENVTNGQIIENYCDASYECIHLISSNSTIIRANNCSSTWKAIILEKTRSNRVLDNRIWGQVRYPIIIGASISCNISFNVIQAYYGITIWSSTGNRLTNNSIEDGEWGFEIINSYSNIISNNSLFGCGFNFNCWSPSYLQTEVNGNTVNDLPLIYWQNQEGGAISGLAGQVILWNCTQVIVHDLTLENGTFGIDIQHSRHIFVSNNIITEHSRDGVRLMNSSFCQVTNNQVARNNYNGINIRINAHNNTIANNSVFDNKGNGILISDSANNTISENVCTSNADGIALEYSDYNRVLDNLCESNSFGIQLDGSDFTYLANNLCSSNGIGIDLDRAHNNTVTFNQLHNNKWGLYIGGSGDNTITFNTFVDCGIFLTYAMFFVVVQSLLQKDVSGNTVNGEPLIFWQNIEGRTISGNIGQVILLNCSQITIHNQTLSNSTAGIFIYFAHNIEISHIVSHHNRYGIYLWSVNHTTITNCSFAEDVTGISIEGNSQIGMDSFPACENITITWNAFYNFTFVAVRDYGRDTFADFNYWAHYQGIDADGDGIGDTPHHEGSLIDYHPLILPPGTPIMWVYPPIDQVLFIGEPYLFHAKAVALPPGPKGWWINDTHYFVINQNGVISNATILGVGYYSLKVTVNDAYGNQVMAEFTVQVTLRPYTPRPEDWLVVLILIDCILFIFLVAVVILLEVYPRFRNKSNP